MCQKPSRNCVHCQQLYEICNSNDRDIPVSETDKNCGLKIESLHCRTKTFSQSDINSIPLIRDVMVTELWTHVFRVLLETLIYGTMTFSFSSLLIPAQHEVHNDLLSL